MDPELVVRAINFHGSDLLDVLQKLSHNNQLLSCIDQRQIDYFEYHKRVKDNRVGFEKKLIKLHNFIAQKAPLLFKRNKPNAINLQELDNEDYYAIMPPLEAFMGVPEKERYRYFFECLRKGDVVIGVIHAKQNIGFIVKLVCMDLGKNREIHDTEIKALCPLSQAATVSSHENPLDTYQIKDLIRGVVLDVVPESEKIILSMKTDALPEHLQSTMKLGLISEEDLPTHYRKSKKIQGDVYETVIDRTLGFMNPSNVSYLSGILGLSDCRASLMEGLHDVEYPKEEYAASLRKLQSAKWAMRSVADGINYFKSGNHTEAFQCLNKALQIDSENVEALVARGALYANNGNFTRALEDFEQAIELNSKHQNARKYMVETLTALARQYEDKKEYKLAMKSYCKALALNPDHREALDSLHALEEKEKSKSLLPKQSQPSNETKLVKEAAPSDNSNDTKEKLRQLLKEEKKKDKTRNSKNTSRSSSSSRSSVSSSSSASSSTISSSSRSSRSSSRTPSPKHSRRFKKRSKKRSYSPTDKHKMYRNSSKHTNSKYASGNSSVSKTELKKENDNKSWLEEKVLQIKKGSSNIKKIDDSYSESKKLKLMKGGEKDVKEADKSFKRTDSQEFAERLKTDKGRDFILYSSEEETKEGGKYGKEKESFWQGKPDKTLSGNPNIPGLDFSELESRLQNYYQKFDPGPDTSKSEDGDEYRSKAAGKSDVPLSGSAPSNSSIDNVRRPSPKVMFIMKPDEMDDIGKKYLGKVPHKENEIIDPELEKDNWNSPSMLPSTSKDMPLIGKEGYKEKMMIKDLPPDKHTKDVKKIPFPKDRSRSRSRSYSRSRSITPSPRKRSRSRSLSSRSKSPPRSYKFRSRRSESNLKSRYRRHSYSRSRSSTRSRSYTRSRSRSRSYSRSRSHSRSRSRSRHRRSYSRSPYRRRSRSRSHSRHRQSYPERSRYRSFDRKDYHYKPSYYRDRKPYYDDRYDNRRPAPYFRGRGRGYFSPRGFTRSHRPAGRMRSHYFRKSPGIVCRAVVPFYKDTKRSRSRSGSPDSRGRRSRSPPPKSKEAKIKDGDKTSDSSPKHTSDSSPSKTSSRNYSQQSSSSNEKPLVALDNLEDVESMLQKHKAQKKAEILATNKDIKKTAMW